MILHFTIISGKNYLVLTYTRPKNKSDIDYRVEVTQNLKNWVSGTNVVSKIISSTSTNDVIQVQDKTPITQNKSRFIRLQINTK